MQCFTGIVKLLNATSTLQMSRTTSSVPRPGKRGFGRIDSSRVDGSLRNLMLQL